MRSSLRLLLLLCALAGSWSRADNAPDSPAALAAAIDTAIAARDASALISLVHTEGLSNEDRQSVSVGLAELIPEEGRATVTAERLSDTIDIGEPQIHNGRRIELSAPPVGIIRVSSKQGRASLVATIPYVRVGDGFLLAGRRSTDLGWKGPADRQLGFTFVEDYPSGDFAITIGYNASGVDLEWATKYHSGVLLGQHIGTFTITGLPEGFKGRLVLKADGKEYYRSEPITGVTDFTYRRPVE